MNEQIGNQLIDLMINWAPWFAIATARPAGFTLLFAIFAWGRLNSGMMRMAFAIAIAMPIFMASVQDGGFHRLAMPIIPTLVKETFIGALLGFFASLPIAIAASGGAIIDFYRGAFQGGADPSGGQMTQTGTLFSIICIWLFAQLGGFWVVASLIYQSYEFWPLQDSYPKLADNNQAILSMIESLVQGALILAGPVLLIMFISDMVHLVSTKFGKQINVTHLAFSSKNLIYMILLPLFVLIALRAIKGDFLLLEQSIEWMKMSLI